MQFPTWQRVYWTLLTVALAALLAACAGTGPAEAPAAPAEAEAGAGQAQASEEVDISDYSEAPQLAEMVDAGDLPPVAERLPANPLMVDPIEEVGVYGGSWLVYGDNQSRIENVFMWNDLGFMSWNRAQNASEPALAEEWEVLEDGTEFVIHLREGLKWSDGEPFTADDVMFWYEDIILNDELTPVKPGWMITANGHLGTIEKVDDTTVRFLFDEPHGMFVTLLTKELITYAPQHYMEQFHVDYAEEDALQQRIEDEGVGGWVDLFMLKWNMGDDGTMGMNNPELPTMNPWMPTVEPPNDRFIFERNPYFWAVDTAGNQLPYIDQVDFRVVDPEVLNLNITAGEPNFQASRAQTFQNMSLYMQYAEENEYEVLQWGDLQISEAAIWINQNAPEPVDRELYQDVRFRHALSLAINRERINETLYLGMGQPTAATLAANSPYYKEEYARAYTEYDPDQANELLDEMGLDERDSEDFRLKPDGNRLAPVIEVPNERLGMIDNLTMIKEDYREIGVDLNVRPIDQSLWGTRMRSGQMQFVGWPMAKAETETDLVPISTNTDWGPLWGLWYNTGGEEGEEPPQEMKDLQAVWTDILLTVDEEEKAELYDTILAAQAENIWAIGVVGPVPKPIVKKTWFRNVLEECIWSFHHGHFIGCTEPYQFFIERDYQ